MVVKWGILATGAIAESFVEDFDYVKTGIVQAVASRTESKAKKFAKKFGIKTYYSSYKELVKADDIDIVYIATPHHLHFRFTILCLENKKAVLCEKPIAINSKQLEQMIESAKENQCFLMEAIWTYFLPAITQVQNWINKGEIGDIQKITADFSFKAKFDLKNRFFDPALAGGALLDVGIYPIALSTLLIKSHIANLHAGTKWSQTGVDETTDIVIEYQNGVKSIISCSIVRNGSQEFLIEGSTGTIRIPKFWRANSAFLSKGSKNLEVFHDYRKSKGYNFEVEDVNRSLQRGDIVSNTVPHCISLENLRIMDKIRSQIGLRYPFELN